MRRAPAFALTVGIALFASATPAHAHLGSPDVFYEGDAGPYRVFVTVRPPEVIPGVADVQIRSAAADLTRVRIVPLPLMGAGAQFAPTPDVAARLPEDPQLYSGHLWLMSAGSWQVRVLVEGARGTGELSVPVPTLPRRTKGMQATLGALLAALLLLLAAAVVAIVGANAREARLEPGAIADPIDQKRARRAMAVAAALVAIGLGFAANWWRAEAKDYAAYVYKPLALAATVEDGRLALRMSDPGWLPNRQLDDLLPDHDHLMHLFVVRTPALDRVWHLHPSSEGGGRFTQALPAMPAGSYQLFADIVHASGVPETLTATLDLARDVAGAPLTGDDSTGEAPPPSADETRSVAPLSGGAQMIWEREAPPEARKPGWFRFRVEESGKPVDDLELYMGMLGHAAFVARDLSVFAHVHPSGSVPMAALSLAQGADPHAQHHHHAGATLPSVVGFPYAFPKPGDYRIFVQVKRRGQVETGVFDAHVAK